MGNAHQVFQWVFTSPRLQVQMFLTRSIKQAEALLPGNSARLGLSWQAQPPGEPGRAAWVHLPRRWPSPSPRQTEPPPPPHPLLQPKAGPRACKLPVVAAGTDEGVSRTKEDSEEPGPASSLFPLLSGGAQGGGRGRHGGLGATSGSGRAAGQASKPELGRERAFYWQRLAQVLSP